MHRRYAGCYLLSLLLMIVYLCAGCDPAKPPVWDDIFLAAAHGDSADVNRHIDAGANVDIRNGLGETPLMWAVYYNHINVIKCLVRNGADVNAQRNDGYTALMRAVGCDYISIVRYLVNNGADVNARDNAGYTALEYAILRDRRKAAEYLERHGAKR